LQTDRTNHRGNQGISTRILFLGLWLLLFVLYFPAAKAGFVSDYTGWLDQIRNHSFTEYLNRTNFKVVSLYQFTQFVTWLVYQVFGTNAWMWHLLFITMHVVNACLLAKIVDTMLQKAGATNYATAIYWGAVLFCVTPYISEVIVWEPSFHYLLGMMMMLLVMRAAQLYYDKPEKKYVIVGIAVYLVSTHSLEVFYLTPWLVLSLLVFHRIQDPQKQGNLSKAFLWFFVAELVIFLLRVVEYRVVYGDWVSRIGSETSKAALESGLGKPAKYLFHLLFVGRYLPEQWHIGQLTLGHAKNLIYGFLDSRAGIVSFLVLVSIAFGICIVRYKKVSGTSRVIFLLSGWLFASLMLITPLWFGDMMLIVYDRYSYFACAFFFMLLAILIMAVPNRYLRYTMLTVVVLANLRYAVQASRYWGKSSKIISGLLSGLPNTNGKTVLLLNIPQSMHGAPMIGASEDSEFKLMHDLLLPDKKTGAAVYDVLAYNMTTPEDGAHVVAVNDSTIKVTLNQWGTWWWYEGQGGHSYENAAYKLNVVDVGHEYVLTLKQQSDSYLLLYQVGEKWKIADMSKTGAEQF
jgi:hypothetical protein